MAAGNPVPGFSAVAVDGAGPVALSALRTDVLGSPTAAAAAAAGQRTPGSSAKARQLVYTGQLYGVEVVGRKCSVLHNRHGKQGFEKAHVLDFDPQSGQHKLRHHVDKVEEWLNLADIKFKWSQGATPEAAPNPTFKPELCGEAAVGKRLRVYWPAMQKWYCGTVRAYEPVSGLHTVYYKDGDQQSLMLKHEPIIWADDELAMQDSSNPLITWVAANSGSGSEAWGAGAGGTTPRHSSSSAAVGAGGVAAAAMAPGLGVMMQPPAASGAVPGGMIPVAATGAAATAAGGAACGPAGLNLLVGRSQMGLPGSMAAAAAGGQGVAQAAARSPAMAAAAAAAMHTAILRTVFPATPLGRGRIKLKMGPGRSMLGKHGRGECGSADGAAKRRKGPAGAKLRHAALAAAAATAIPNKHLAVGCRVGVYWRLDKAFYTGKLKSCSSQTGKFTLQYDDGQCEQLLLERERFIWHAPRGMTAGYKPALHSLMQALGAEGLKALPQDGPDGKTAPLTPRPEGAAHPPSTGSGAVGWRVQLYWPADGLWHEAEVLSYNEAKRVHHVLYLDGEEEWLDLSNEMVVWNKATRGGALSAGHFLSSEEVPKARDALGWHIAVYWKDDKQFYPGQVADFDASNGKHKVLYHDGEEEFLQLRNERVIWRMGPSEASEDGEDDIMIDEVNLDSDDSIDIMEAEETDDATDDDTPGSKKKGGRVKRIRRKLRTRKSRMSRLGFESDQSSEPGRLMRHQHGGVWGQGPTGLAAAGSSFGHHDPLHRGTFNSPLEPAAASTTAAGSAFGHFSAARPPLAAGPYGDAGAGGTTGKGVIGRQPSANGLAGAIGSMRAPPPPGAPSAAGGGVGLQARGSSHGGLARASSSGLLGVSSSALLSLNLPAINIRRSGPSGDGTGSPLIRQSLEQIQLAVRITPGSSSRAATGTTAAAAEAAAAAAAAGGSAATGAGAAAATAAALQPIMQHLPPGRKQAAAVLQRKMDRLDMILSKLTATANMYGWRLETQEPLPPLLPPMSGPQRQGAAGGGAVGPRSRSQPTSPTGVAGSGRPGLGSPRHSGGPLSPHAAAAAARASTTGGSLPTSPRNALGPISPTAAAAAAAAAPGRPVAVHKTCAVKSRPVGGAPTGSNGNGTQRIKGWGPYGGVGAGGNNPPSSSSTGQHAGIGSGTAGGSGELTSVLAAATGQQQGGAAGAQLAAAAEAAAKHQQQVAAAAALQHATQALAMPGLSAAGLAALTGPAGVGSDASLAASAARAAIEAMLTSGVNPITVMQVSNPAVPSVSRAADEVVQRLQVMAQANSPHIQQQLQSLQAAAAAAAAAANAAAAAAASAAVNETAAAAARPLPAAVLLAPAGALAAAGKDAVSAAAAVACSKAAAKQERTAAAATAAGTVAADKACQAAAAAHPADKDTPASAAAATPKAQQVHGLDQPAAAGVSKRQQQQHQQQQQQQQQQPSLPSASKLPDAAEAALQATKDALGKAATAAAAAPGKVADPPKAMSKAAAALAGLAGKSAGEGGKGAKTAGGRAGKQQDSKK